MENAGKISHELAKEAAESEYEKFHREQIRLSDKKESDFDSTVKQIEAYKKQIEGGD